MATLFTNLSPIGENLHWPESGAQNTVRATRLFCLFRCQSLGTPALGLVAASDYRPTMSGGRFNSERSVFVFLGHQRSLKNEAPQLSAKGVLPLRRTTTSPLGLVENP
jgi:hypothetical protein